MHGLQSVNPGVSRLACGLISDLASCLEEQIAQYSGEFLQHLVKILEGDNYDKETKINAITAIGDLCMYSSEKLN